MEFVKVPGKNSNHAVLIYALSTCVWCKMTKQFLKDKSIAYQYVDVDLSSDKDREKIRKDIKDRGGEPTYPTIIVDDKVLITGFRKDLIKEALDI
jgi:glutaredoxin-like protein NrdH